MGIYVALFSLMALFNVWIDGNTGQRRKQIEAFCCNSVIIILILLAALRDITVGTDTAGYIRDYEIVKYLSYDAIMSRYFDNPGYYIVSKFFADLGLNVHIWFGIVEALYLLGVSNIIERFSKNKMLSYLMFVTLGFYGFSLAGLKQVMAMSFTLYAFIYLWKQKYLWYFVFMGIARFFHGTSIVFALAFISYLLRKRKSQYYLLFAVFCVVFLFYGQILGGAVVLLGNDHYIEYLDGSSKYSPVVLLTQIAILAFSMIYGKKYRLDHREEAILMYSLTGLGAIAQVFAFAVASFFRISLYFSIFSITLLPTALKYESKSRHRAVYTFIVYTVFIFYFCYTGRNGTGYRFYWG